MDVDGSYNLYELMVVVAARHLENNSIVFTGTGIPMLAVALAQKTHAPDIIPIYEAGGIAPQMPTLPLSVGCSRTTHRTIKTADMPEVMETLQKGLVAYAFLGGAQIDKYGNLNSTVLGSYDDPAVRLPGSGGANDGGSLCWRTMIIMNHERRRFVERCDYITTPGYLDGPGSRERAGLPPGCGPYRVFTNLGVLDFEEKTKRMRLIAVNPGCTVEDVIRNTGFELLLADEIKEVEPPTAEELRILREEVDPLRIVLGRADRKD